MLILRDRTINTQKIKNGGSKMSEVKKVITETEQNEQSGGGGH